MTDPHAHRLDHPLGDAQPAPGAVLDVAPGVRWVRMPLPFALDHINLWLLRDRDDEGRDGWTVVDCGIADDATRSAWEQVFTRGLDGLPVLRVVVTHMHPDHVGLAHWLTERWGCRLWISATDYHVGRLACQSTTGQGGEQAAAFFAGHGLTDPEAIAQVRERRDYYARMVPKLPSQYRRLMDSMTIAIGAHAWRCLAGHGHAPEHIALHGEAPNVLIAGDMVLPRISTNVSVYDTEPEADPLPLYLASLERLRTLPPDTLVLPSHGRPFVGLHARIDQLRAHHDARLADTLAACRRQPTSAHDLLPLLFRRHLDLHQTTFAMGEAIAHLHALWFDGQLSRQRDRDGVWRFAAA
jgi:glyoxylase-like metal-dependent hydrolase (beta-lactamase superfamily II)